MFYKIQTTENDEVNPAREWTYVVRANDKRGALQSLAKNLSNRDVAKMEIVEAIPGNVYTKDIALITK
jgi:hypothetical protein